MPDAWEGQSATALSIATALHQKQGVNLPWTVVRDVIDAALRASFIELDTDSGPWPCELAGAQNVRAEGAVRRSAEDRSPSPWSGRACSPPRPSWSRTRFKTSAT